MKKTLTIILGLTREANFTYPSLLSKVLIPLDSDLAFCGSAHSDEPDPILENSKFVWNEPDPTDWSAACDSISLDYGSWREFGKVPSNLLTGSFPNQTAGPGMIFAYRWEILRRHITEEILNSYEWFVITRSDFLWEIEHPSIDLLQKEKIYQMDGYTYGGITDRHIVFHREYARKIFAFAKPIFGKDVTIKNKFVATLGKATWQNSPVNHLNFEQYLLFITREFGLENQFTLIPYLGYLIRHEKTATNWSSGVFYPNRNFYIKYPNELAAVSLNKILFRSQKNWSSFFNHSITYRLLLLLNTYRNLLIFKNSIRYRLAMLFNNSINRYFSRLSKK
jgi:hypothetical protein